jgi:hypothetical protein
MRIPPAILSFALLLLGLAWIASATVHGRHVENGSLDGIPSFWLAMFYVGGAITIFIAGMLITVRRRDCGRFEIVDRIALCTAAIGTILFLAILAWMLIKYPAAGGYGT